MFNVNLNKRYATYVIPCLNINGIEWNKGRRSEEDIFKRLFAFAYI